jgi:hypothetical protein
MSENGNVVVEEKIRISSMIRSTLFCAWKHEEMRKYYLTNRQANSSALLFL